VWQKGDAKYIADVCADKKAIVGGLYSKRALGKGWAGRFGYHEEPHEFGSYELVDLGPDGFIGGGFMAIHREVLLGIGAHYKMPVTSSGFIPFFIPECRMDEETGECLYLSEDWVICHRAREAGFKTFVSMKPVLMHVGNFPYSVLGTSR